MLKPFLVLYLHYIYLIWLQETKIYFRSQIKLIGLIVKEYDNICWL